MLNETFIYLVVNIKIHYFKVYEKIDIFLGKVWIREKKDFIMIWVVVIIQFCVAFNICKKLYPLFSNNVFWCLFAYSCYLNKHFFVHFALSLHVEY